MLKTSQLPLLSLFDDKTCYFRFLALKTCQFQLEMGLSLGENARIFNERHFLRFSTIFNAQTVHYIYMTNKKPRKEKYACRSLSLFAI